MVNYQTLLLYFFEKKPSNIRVHFNLSHGQTDCGRWDTAPVGVPTNRRQIEMHPTTLIWII